MAIMLRSAMSVTRDAFVVGLLWMALACPSRLRAAAGDNVLRGLDPLTVPVSVLRTRIALETTKVVQSLSPEGKDAVHRSLLRFLDWARGYCQGDTRCLSNQYYNYLAAIPNSVYRVGRWTVYNTGVYALEWADEDLQGMDPDRALTWDFRLTWPRVDAKANPMRGHVTLAESAYGALAARVHKLMSDWIQAGWNRSLDAHLEGVNDCYVSANITGSTYSGGAHPYEKFSTFNWNVGAKRALQNTDLFRTDTEWKSEILALYRQRLQASGTGLSEWALSSDGMNSLFTDGFVITDNGLRFVEHEGATRNESVPAIDLSWHELAPWLVPGAICSIPPSDQPR
jgi:hypothetical protein